MANAWMRFMAECRKRYGNDAWNVPADGALPTDEVLHIVRMRFGDKPLLFFTKQSFSTRIDASEEEIQECDLWTRYGLPTRAFLQVFERCNRHRTSILFVGDLDPCDLATFRALQCGSPDLLQKRGWRLPVQQVGVNSRWMDSADHWGKGVLDRVTIRMDPLERRQYRALRDSWTALPEIIGDRAMDLLEGGRKLEIEGAVAFWLGKPEFNRELLDLMLGNVERRSALRTIRSGSERDAMRVANTLLPTSDEQASLQRLVNNNDVPVHNRLAAFRALYRNDQTGPGTFMGYVIRRDIPLEIRAEAGERLLLALNTSDRRAREFRLVIQDLACCLERDNPEARLISAQVLGRIRAKSALPELRRLAQSDRSRVPGRGTVAKAAREAIKLIESA